jgi:transcriptional regulator with XRE-family HTH domain
VKIAYAAVKMRTELGEHLRQGRVARGLSLEAASRAAKISQGYLHKLEAGGVENPSPRVLQRLGEVLDVSYRRLMELAGYVWPAEGDTSPSPSQEERMPTATDAAAPTNRELQKLLHAVLAELDELKRGQQQVATALERASPGG